MENVEKDRQRAEVFDALGHPTRIAILKALNEGAMGFADLKKRMGIDSSGHLQHHLNKLDGLIKTDEYGKYCLSDQGKDALLTVQTVEKAAGSGVKKTGRVQAQGLKSKRVLTSIVVSLAILLVISSSIAVLEYSQILLLQSEINRRNGLSVSWEHDIGVNIADFAVADGKVFVMTFDGDLYCFDQQSGQTLWSYSLGGYVMWGPLITVADGKVFAGASGSRGACFNENTGALLWQFQPSYFTTSFSMKAPPEFTVADGKVFTTGDGLYSVNATNGELIWGYETWKSVFAGPWAVADGRVFIASMENAIWYLYSLNADDGEVLWTYKIFTSLESSPIVADGRVFVWDRWQNQTMLCLNETSSSLLWNYDVGATIFQPTVYNGLLLFGASNGDFYALNISDGTLKWTYQTTYQVVTGTSVAPIAVSDKILTGYEEGYISCLNLSNGHSIWAAPIPTQARSLTLGENVLYVTESTNLYSIDLNTGNINWTRNFTYWVLPPIYSYNKLFVVADLKVIAYG